MSGRREATPAQASNLIYVVAMDGLVTFVFVLFACKSVG